MGKIDPPFAFIARCPQLLGFERVATLRIDAEPLAWNRHALAGDRAVHTRLCTGSWVLLGAVHDM